MNKSILNKAWFLVFLSCFILQDTWTQAPSENTSNGPIPDEFLKLSSKKYNQQIKRNRNSKQKISNSKRKAEGKFYLESIFEIDKLLKSGKVLFNDELGDYVNSVFAKLPIDPKLKKKKNPRIYIVNSSEVNAFATDQGIIFVTVGLLASIESESQLAFILAHELAHIEEGHVMDEFLTSNQYDKEQWLQNLSDKDKVFKKALYSRKLEKEADSLGLNLFLKTDYGHEDLENVFTSLYYSYLSYSEKSFDRSFFEDENYRFPDYLWLEDVNEISPMEDGSEESTHPSSASRMKTIKSRISRQKETTDTASDDAEFKKHQEIARFQLPYLCIKDGDYFRAIYDTFVLSEKYPDNAELKKLNASALFMEAKRVQLYLSDMTDEDDDAEAYKQDAYEGIEEMEGAMHRIGHLFANMTNKELTILALKHNYEAWLEDKQDEQLNMAINSLMTDLTKRIDNLDEFSNEPRPVVEPKEEEEEEEEEVKLDSLENKELTKEEKIKLANRELLSDDNEINFSDYAFVGYANDEDFITRFEEAKKKRKKNERLEDEEEDKKGGYFSRRRDIVTEHTGLGIKKVVVINPRYISIEKGSENIDHLLSEEKRLEFQDRIETMAKLSNVKTKMLNVDDLRDDDAKTFTELAELEFYLSEQMYLPSGLHPTCNQNKINEIAEAYGTDYFLWTGMIYVDQSSFYAFYYSSVALAPAYLNLILFDYLLLKGASFHFAILCDVKTGKRQVFKLDSVRGKLTSTMLDAHLYDVFHQISSKE